MPPCCFQTRRSAPDSEAVMTATPIRAILAHEVPVDTGGAIGRHQFTHRLLGLGRRQPLMRTSEFKPNLSHRLYNSIPIIPSMSNLATDQVTPEVYRLTGRLGNW